LAGVGAGPTIVDFQVAAFNPSVLQQTQPKSCNPSLSFCISFGDAGDQYAETAHAVRLLRPRRERVSTSCAYKETDELAPPCMSRKQHSEG